MKNSFQLFLEGHGYLEGVEHRKGKTLARIRIEQLPFQGYHLPDEVALDCTVETPLLLSIVQALESRRLAGDSILFRFRATYTRFGVCFNGLTPEDPKNILILDGELQMIKGWLQDNCWILPEPLAWEKVSSVLAAA
jgi:hypothetical protein